MKKILACIMVLILSLSLVGCGGGQNSSPAPSTPSQPSVQQEEEKEYTPEQQALAQEFVDMIDAYNAVVDRVNATPELLEDEELIEVMNELAGELTKIDEFFTDPEILTPEVMEAIKVTIEATYEFVTEAEAALDEIESAK